MQEIDHFQESLHVGESNNLNRKKIHYLASKKYRCDLSTNWKQIAVTTEEPHLNHIIKFRAYTVCFHVYLFQIAGFIMQIWSNYVLILMCTKVKTILYMPTLRIIHEICTKLSYYIQLKNFL